MPKEHRAYAQVLDSFGIELGLAGGGDPEVTYLSELSEAEPRVRRATGKTETRLYFSIKGEESRALAKLFADRADVAAERRIPLHFIPKGLENRLAELEKTRAGDTPTTSIKKTVFSTRRSGDKFDVYVVSQEF